ncbi:MULTISPECIES: hypothetical protein [Pseudomonadaceae]|uniref:hypothetical protein n=1 Tax=Pseudomonadaceae TaxID=135621 RepID=UPI001F106F5A|nr:MULTISPECIES: hypothetical protein [Pseudomonas]
MNLSETGCFSDELIAFVITCLFCGAISRDEFNTWCAQALSLDDAPVFLYDLMDFHDEIFKIYQVIGYVPHWEHAEDDEYALYGIAVRRGFEPYDMPLTTDKALASLGVRPDIERLFGKVFDFIEL